MFPLLFWSLRNKLNFKKYTICIIDCIKINPIPHEHSNYSNSKLNPKNTGLQTEVQDGSNYLFKIEMPILVWEGILSIQQVCNFFSYFSALLLTMRRKLEKSKLSVWNIKLNSAIISFSTAFVNTGTDANISTKVSEHKRMEMRQGVTVKSHTAAKAHPKRNSVNLQLQRSLMNSDIRLGMRC